MGALDLAKKGSSDQVDVKAQHKTLDTEMSVSTPPKPILTKEGDVVTSPIDSAYIAPTLQIKNEGKATDKRGDVDVKTKDGKK